MVHHLVKIWNLLFFSCVKTKFQDMPAINSEEWEVFYPQNNLVSHKRHNMTNDLNRHLYGVHEMLMLQGYQLQLPVYTKFYADVYTLMQTNYSTFKKLIWSNSTFSELISDIQDTKRSKNTVFSEEATFQTGGLINRHNCRIWKFEISHQLIKHRCDSPMWMFGIVHFSFLWLPHEDHTLRYTIEFHFSITRRRGSRNILVYHTILASLFELFQMKKFPVRQVRNVGPN
jgi:hypothetical protein